LVVACGDPRTVTMPAVRKAIFPAAGLGTRFLPVTKAQPKEMLPLVAKRAIVDHFDRSLELEHYLRERGKTDMLRILSEVDELSNQVDITYLQQKEPRGLGHAVWTARRLVEGESCAVLLADDVILGASDPCLKQLIDAHLKTGATVLAVRRFPRSQVGRYGVVAIDGSQGRVHDVTDMVEKPEAGTEPSDLCIIGRY